MTSAGGSYNIDQQQQTWGQMVNEVVVHGNPNAVRSAALDWEQVIRVLHTLRADLLQNLADFRQFNVWQGAAFDQYASRIQGIAGRIEQVIQRCDAGTGQIDDHMRIFADALNTAQLTMPRPDELGPDIKLARDTYRDLPPGSFPNIQDRLSGAEKSDNTWRWWWDDQTAETRKIYNALDTTARPPATAIPSPDGLDGRSVGRQPGPQPPGPGAGSAGGMPSMGGMPGGQGSDIGSPGGMPRTDPAGAGPRGSELGNGSIARDPLNDPRAPESPDLSNNPQPSTSQFPDGGGLAGGGAYGGGAGAGGLPSGGLGPGVGSGVGGPGGYGSAGGSAGGLPAGPTGKPVTPPFGGMMPPMGGAGAGGQRSGSGRKPNSLISGPGMAPGSGRRDGRREDGMAGPSSWLYEDDDIWGANPDVPPAVIDSDWYDR